LQYNLFIFIFSIFALCTKQFLIIKVQSFTFLLLYFGPASHMVVKFSSALILGTFVSQIKGAFQHG